MPKYNSPEEAAFAMREKTKPLPEIPDRRGPLVYDLTFQPSLNGVNPDVYGMPNTSERTVPIG